MEIRINNKNLMECEFQDIEILIQNLDYRENQYLDYKETFSFLEISKETANYRDLIQKRIVGFRNDICSFANAEGGYIIFGISENQGTADKIVGVVIDNPDKFELDIRNKLTPIMPKAPHVNFHFIRIENDRYIIVLQIKHDYFAPYIHIEDQKNYKIYKRVGNKNQVIEYTELKNMFMQSKVLEDAILEFRKKRIEYYHTLAGEKYRRFLIFHIIPESFLNERKQLFLLEKQNHWNLGAVFSETGVEHKSSPCVDGLRYRSYEGNKEAILYNNGIAEFVLSLAKLQMVGEGEYFPHQYVWNYVEYVAQGYQRTLKDLFGNQRYFGCVSIVGCKGVISEQDDLVQFNSLIDRDKIFCWPVVFNNMDDQESFYNDLRTLHLEYFLALGITRKQDILELIKEIEISP